MSAIRASLTPRFLFLAAALVALAVFLVNDSRPVSADHGATGATILSATLTVDVDAHIYYGCNTASADIDSCSDTSVLTEDEFSHGGKTYTVHHLLWLPSGELNISIAENGSPILILAAKAALSAVTVHVQGKAFAIRDARGLSNSSELIWDYEPPADWTDGQQVSVKLTTTPHAQSVLWSATLSPADKGGVTEGGQAALGGRLGCETDSEGKSPYLCSGLLSPSDSFTHGGTTYRVTSIGIGQQLDPTSRALAFSDERSLGITTNPRLPDHWALRVGDKQFLVRDALYAGGEVGYNKPRSIRWLNTGLSWTAGEGVPLHIVIPADVPTVSLSASPNPVKESGIVQVTVRLSSALASDVNIPLVATPGSAESGDYTMFGQYIAITAGELSTTLGVVITVPDTDPTNYLGTQQDEDFTVALRSGLPPSVLPGDVTSARVWIVDDDPSPTLSLHVSPLTVTEGDDVRVRVSLSRHVGAEVSIPITVTPNTTHNHPAESSDFSAPSSVTIPAGRAHGIATITTSQDSGDDYEEFTVRLGTLPDWVTADGPTSSQVTILDDEGAEPVSSPGAGQGFGGEQVTDPHTGDPVPDQSQANRAPTVDLAIDNATIRNESGTHRVTLSGRFTDPDSDPLTITAASSDTAVATVSVAADESSLTLTAQARGTATITVTASDGNGGTVSDSFDVTVKAAPVVASALADLSLEPETNQDVSLTGVFSDADGDALTITAASSDTDAVLASLWAGTLTVVAAAEGTATITVTAEDADGNRVSDQFDVTVAAAPVQQPPQETPPVDGGPAVVAPVADFSLVGPEHREVSLSDVFSGDGLTFRAVSSNYAVASMWVSGSTLMVVGTGTGTATITVTAKDSDGNSVSDAFEVTVRPVS